MSTLLETIVLDVYAYQLWQVFNDAGEPSGQSWEDLNESAREKWRAVAAQAIQIAEEKAT